MSNFQTLSALIWNVADDVLRGLFKPHEYGDVILPFVILRRLDCVIEPRKDEIYNLNEEYKTKVEDPSPVIRNRIQAEFYNTSKYDLSRLKQDPKNVFINFRNYINGFSKNVYDIIENFQLDKPVEKLLKNNRLFLLVEKLLVSLVFSGDREDLQGKGKIRSVFDPCCGTGGMLTILISIMITNPPFGVSWKSEEEFVTAEAQNPNGRFFAGTPRTSDGSLLFLQHMISKMEEKGSRIGIVFNGSPLFTGDAGSDYFHERTSSFVFAGGCQSAQIETLHPFA